MIEENRKRNESTVRDDSPREFFAAAKQFAPRACDLESSWSWGAALLRSIPSGILDGVIIHDLIKNSIDVIITIDSVRHSRLVGNAELLICTILAPLNLFRFRHNSKRQCLKKSWSSRISLSLEKTRRAIEITTHSIETHQSSLSGKHLS